MYMYDACDTITDNNVLWLKVCYNSQSLDVLSNASAKTEREISTGMQRMN